MSKRERDSSGSKTVCWRVLVNTMTKLRVP